jgi:hypothetical protein
LFHSASDEGPHGSADPMNTALSAKGCELSS